MQHFADHTTILLLWYKSTFRLRSPEFFYAENDKEKKCVFLCIS